MNSARQIINNNVLKLDCPSVDISKRMFEESFEKIDELDSSSLGQVERLSLKVDRILSDGTDNDKQYQAKVKRHEQRHRLKEKSKPPSSLAFSIKKVISNSSKDISHKSKIKKLQEECN
jgi:hypothetical protein